MTKIITVKDHGSNAQPYEVMFFETENAYGVQVKDYEPDYWHNKKNALAFFNYFKNNKIIISQ